MQTLTRSDLEVLLGPMGSKVWYTEGRIEVNLFVDMFVIANFKPEMALYGFLLKDQNWKELLKALKTFDTSGSDSQTTSSAVGKEQENDGITRSDLEHALQRFIALNKLTQGYQTFFLDIVMFI